MHLKTNNCITFTQRPDEDNALFKVQLLATAESTTIIPGKRVTFESSHGAN